MAALVTIAAGCRRSAPVEVAAPVTVRVQVVRPGTLRDVASAPGTVVPAAAGDWTISGPEPAVIVELPKKEGDSVAPGDLLVRFDVPSITQLLAARELDRAQAASRLDQAKATAANQQALFARGLIARNALAADQDSVSAAEAALGQAESQLALAKAEAGRATITARFAGTVQHVWHAVGDTVAGDPTDPVLQVVDPSHVEVAIQLPVLQVGRVQPGQLAAVRTLTDPGEHAARVTHVKPPTDPTAATGEVRVALLGDATLPLDTPVSVEILFDQRAQALTVPLGAMHREGSQQSVFIVGDDGRAHERAIRTGLVTHDAAEIVNGLTAGDRVIVDATEMTDGEPVSVAGGPDAVTQ
jgi:RND family efflux transporter MFP subunit